MTAVAAARFTAPGDPNLQYSYDAIGNLTEDKSSGVTSTISWNVYGKIEHVTRTDGNATSFAYDAQGNRVRKTRSTSNGGLLEHTYYVRDAQGNVLAVYEQQEPAGQAATAIRLLEQPLYGSSRLGLRKLAAGRAPAAGAAGYYTRVTQQKQYELVDHLGNVRALVSDTKRVDAEVAGTYKPDLLAYFNYYPFGMQQPGRSAPSTTTGSGGYRYGFNGKEKDNNGELGLTNYDYGFRIYNPGLGRFLSVDPLTDKYTWLTPYQFGGNTPIAAIDLDGLEPQVTTSTVGGATAPVLVREGAKQVGAKILEHPATKEFAAAQAARVLSMLQVGGTAVILTAILVCIPTNVGNHNAERQYQEFVQRRADASELDRLSQKGHLTPEESQRLQQLSTRLGIRVAGAPITESLDKFGGRQIIIDENLSPKLASLLKNAGYNVKTFPKGTLDPDIIDYARNNDAIVMTNNIKDFKNQSISTIKISEKLKSNSNVPLIVNQLNSLSDTYNKDPSILSSGKGVGFSAPNPSNSNPRSE